jgi:hypothetical protein
MLVAGIAVAATDPKRPIARLVFLDSADGNAAVKDTVELPSDNVSAPIQLHDAAEALRSHLKSRGPKRIVVRRADRSPAAKQTDGPKFRLLMEGALVSAACSVIPDTRLGTGKETAEWFGASKGDMDAKAGVILDESSVHTKYVEACSAALAAIALGT